jgi:hypothetical protein
VLESKLSTSAKIVLTGTAGLVGQSLLLRLKMCGYKSLVAIDKYRVNTAVVRRLHADITVVDWTVQRGCNYSAVTAACLLTRREVLEAVSGFNEALAVAFNG